MSISFDYAKEKAQAPSSRYLEDSRQNDFRPRQKSIVNPSALPPAPGVAVSDDAAYETLRRNTADLAELTNEAQKAVENEARMGLWEGLKTYKSAAAWSILLSSTIIMEGYDTNLLGSLFAYPEFAKRFGGEQNAHGEWEVAAAWQTGLMNASAVGSILGLLLNGWLCDHIGYKKSFVFALSLMTAAIFVVFFAPNVTILTLSQFLCGIPWGMFQTLAIAYASEVCPMVLRGYLTTYANICWVIGQILASGVLRGLLSRPDEWAYRIPLALQWVFPVPILIGALFAPESPFWLVRHERFEDAVKVCRRLASKSESDDAVQNRVSMMRLTNEHEKALTAGTTFFDCFKGIDLRRTEIACLTWACQNMCGSAFMGYSTYFYKNAGLATEQAFNFTLSQYALGFLGTVVAWWFMAHFGRRTLYTAGLAILLVLLLAIGGLGFVPSSNTSAAWAIGSLLLIFTAVYNCTVGPVCYAIVSETSSTRLRQKTVVLARASYNLCSLFNNAMVPLMLNPTAFNWGAKTGLFFAGICAVCVVWCYFRLPEAKGRSYNELTVLFENRVSARKFKSTRVEGFRSQSIAVERLDDDGSSTGR